MSEEGLPTDEQLQRAHETVEVELPRWALELLIGATRTVAGADEASNDLRRDCSAAVSIAEARLSKQEDSDA